MAKKSVGARELKNRLGTYLRQAREGRTIVITHRGRPVAELRALSPARGAEEARLAELVALGLLSARTCEEPAGRGQPVKIGKPGLTETLLEDREDRL